MSNDRVAISDECFEYHAIICDLFSKVFCVKPNIFHDENRNTFYSHFKRMALYKFLVEVLEVPRGPVRRSLSLPSYVDSWDAKLKASYIGGLFDSEGHVGKTQAKIAFSITTKDVFEFVKNFLEENKIKVSIYIRNRHVKKEYELYIYGRENIQVFLKLVKFYHPDKVSRLKPFPIH